jgi:CspA family cold shock protein
MATGKIKSLVKDRGFGFIQVEGGSSDIFFHHTSVVGGDLDSLQEGQAVEFDVEADPRDPRRSRASNVRGAS